MRYVVFASVVALAMCGGAAEPDWAELTPVADLEGWRVLGGDWRVENGEVIGRAEAGEVAFLVTEAVYADFELEVEFMTPVPCNGGVQFRGHWLPKKPIPAEGTVPEDLEMEMYGYQANVETRREEGTGSLVDEHGRGWLAEPKPAARETVKPAGWNTLTVWTEGGKILIKVNGVVAVAGRDTKFTKGFLGLQVMGLENQETTEIRYRNLRIKDRGRAGAWEPLFDGESLAGWKEWGSEKWEVVDGMIRGTRGPKESEGYLATEQAFKDFHVRGVYKMLGGGNYGLFYHSAIKLREDGYPVISGLQGEVAPGRPSPSGWVYESYKRGWLVKPDMTRPVAYAQRPGEWNEIEIRCVGNHVWTWINGAQVLDLEDEGQQLFEGSFALQLHSGEGAGVLWKDLYVKAPE